MSALPDTASDGNRWIERRTTAPVPSNGWTVAVKDNIDVAGFTTTAGCPSYGYSPATTAPAVQRLVDAGSVVVGKTNLDQFATGLVGTRSPYGPVESPVAPGLISGGSSSGSAAAVAMGEATIGIGTDTAGSGRIPAGFCGVVGLKGTRGWVPTAGVVPACPSFDCVTVFAATVATAAAAMRTMAGPFDGDPSCRAPSPAISAEARHIGVPSQEVLDDCDDRTQAAFAHAVALAEDAGLRVVTVDLHAYLAAGALLYGGSFVAERYASVGAFLDSEPVDADPSVAAIVRAGAGHSAAEYVRDRGALDLLAIDAAKVWNLVDVVLTPTAPFQPTLDEVAADPIGVNSELGRFVSGANLVDWCAAAVPVAIGGDHPVGIQVLGPAWSDERVWSIASVLTGEPAVGMVASGYAAERR